MTVGGFIDVAASRAGTPYPDDTGNFRKYLTTCPSRSNPPLPNTIRRVGRVVKHKRTLGLNHTSDGSDAGPAALLGPLGELVDARLDPISKETVYLRARPSALGLLVRDRVDAVLTLVLTVH